MAAPARGVAARSAGAALPLAATRHPARHAHAAPQAQLEAQRGHWDATEHAEVRKLLRVLRSLHGTADNASRLTAVVDGLQRRYVVCVHGRLC